MSRERITKLIGIATLWLSIVARCAVAQPTTLQPRYWTQPTFFIPYQVQQRGKLLDPVAKVQLLISRTGASDWSTLDEAQPNVQGFSYHAPEDGDYWFALRHLDRRGQPWPTDAVHPQVRIVVDTQKPELTLDGTSDANGDLVIRYEARDANLERESLVLEVLGANHAWTPITLGEPDVVQPNRLVGRVLWSPPSGARNAEVRASIADRAGQRAQTHSRLAVAVASPSLPKSSRSDPFATATAQSGALMTNPFVSNKKLASHDWPTSNRLLAPTENTSLQLAPPSQNPYTASRGSRTPARLVGDRPSSASSSGHNVGSASQSLQITPLPEDSAPPLVQSTPWPTPQATPQARRDGWAPVSDSNAAPVRVVNSRTFDIDYDLQMVGPWGVSKVEIWGTQDGGKTWRSFGVDADNRSPIRVTVPQAGSYGFRILVDGANSAGPPPPQMGDEPELSVSVDLQPPTAELLAADLGHGNLADRLMVRWTAEDSNLEPRPIALYYSSYPNGPWSTIASGLENTGSYTWRIERHIPGRFYLRLEVRDTAGNLASYQAPTPVVLARPQPTGRLRNVRPITGQ